MKTHQIGRGAAAGVEPGAVGREGKQLSGSSRVVAPPDRGEEEPLQTNRAPLDRGGKQPPGVKQEA